MSKNQRRVLFAVLAIFLAFIFYGSYRKQHYVRLGEQYKNEWPAREQAYKILIAEKGIYYAEVTTENIVKVEYEDYVSFQGSYSEYLCSLLNSKGYYPKSVQIYSASKIPDSDHFPEDQLLEESSCK